MANNLLKNDVFYMKGDTLSYKCDDKITEIMTIHRFNEFVGLIQSDKGIIIINTKTGVISYNHKTYEIQSHSKYVDDLIGKITNNLTAEEEKEKKYKQLYDKIRSLTMDQIDKLLSQNLD